MCTCECVLPVHVHAGVFLCHVCDLGDLGVCDLGVCVCVCTHVVCAGVCVHICVHGCVVCMVGFLHVCTVCSVM